MKAKDLMTIVHSEGNPRILVVDDNQSIHEDFRKILCPKQSSARKEFELLEESLFDRQPAENVPGRTFEMHSACQGRESLELVRKSLADGKPYAVTFMDVRMPPGWDGIETTSRIWELDPDIQVVICTAYSDCSWNDMLQRLGHSDRLVILKKPFDSIEVFQLANSLSRKWQLLQDSNRKQFDLERQVAARTAQIVSEQEKFRSVFEHSPDGIFQASPEGRFLKANSMLAGIYGYASARQLLDEVIDIGESLYVDPARYRQLQDRLQREAVVRNFESEIKCRDGSLKWIRETACRVDVADGAPMYYQGFVVDISDQKRAQSELDLMEVQLRQAQKLESIGQLAAGIAHEINTPVQYIGDNIRFVLDAFNDINHLLSKCRTLAAAAHDKSVSPEMLAELETIASQADLDYIGKEIPNAARQSLDGIAHVTNIVRAMKEFSHPGGTDMVPIDLNHAIENTLTVTRNEWKYVTEVVTKFEQDLPLVPCLPGEVNQVFLNLIINAAHAISDAASKAGGAKGTITICTRLAGAFAEVSISDTGTGIPESIRHRIFEPFFTTKEVGKGTGQGLAIARSTIVSKHGGQIGFDSVMGKGTTFTIRLPLEKN